MIMNSETRHADSASVGMQESISMSIDTSDQVALMSILSENLYKDPIGSLIRESVSNALDTHKEIGSNEPIIVSLVPDTNYGFVFSVQDFGTGISPQVVKDVLSKYASSTKRNSNEYLGYYGLGFKAPLAYTDSFMFVTKFKGVQYRYVMYKSEEGTKIDLVGEQPITDGDLRNGTKIEVQLKERLDHQGFISKIRQQLAYFEGVYFDVPGVPNDFKIIKNEDWKYSGLLGQYTTSNGQAMHICLDNVYYEIDWQRLGIGRINLNVGLNFKIEDGLLPIPSREDIKYTEEAKDLIKIKIAAVSDYFLRKFNETRVDADDFEEIYDKFHGRSVTIEGIVFNVHELEEYSYIKAQKPTLKGIKLLNLENLSNVSNKIFSNYEIRGKIKNHSFTGKWQDEARLLERKNTLYQLIRATEPPKGLQLEYLKDIYPYAEFLYKKRDIQLGTRRTGWLNSSTYYSLLRLDQYPKSQWREVIREFQTITGKILYKIPKLEDLLPTAQWLEERKAKRHKGIRELIGNEEISLKMGRRAERGDHKLTYDAKTISIRKIGEVFQSLIVYGENKDKERLDAFYPLVDKQKRRVKLVLINKYDEKKIKGLHNFTSIDEFMKGKNKPFKAFATAILIDKLQRDNSEIFANMDFVEALSKPLAMKMDILRDYQGDNFPNGYYEEDGFIEEVLRVATEHNLFDEEMMLIYNEVNEKIKFFNFISLIKYGKMEDSRKESLSLAREILRGRKFRMDWENYLGLNPVVEAVDPEDEGEEEESDEDGVAQIASEEVEELQGEEVGLEF